MKTVSQSPTQESVRGWRDVLAPYDLGYRVKLLSQLFDRQLQQRLKPFNLTCFHWVVLCCLWQEDGLAVSIIGAKLQQVGGTLTGVLDRMEERGLICRERDARDRRIWRIWLTKEGKQLQDLLPPIAVEVQKQATKGIPPAQRQRLSQLVNQALANLSYTAKR